MQSVLDAVVEPRRREILRLVHNAELPAGAIAARFVDVSRPAISQHLRVLEEAELVAVRRDGRRRLYRLDPRPLRDVLTWTDEFAVFFAQRLDALGDYLDKKHGKRR